MQHTTFITGVGNTDLKIVEVVSVPVSCFLWVGKGRGPSHKDQLLHQKPQTVLQQDSIKDYKYT